MENENIKAIKNIPDGNPALLPAAPLHGQNASQPPEPRRRGRPLGSKNRRAGLPPPPGYQQPGQQITQPGAPAAPVQQPAINLAAALWTPENCKPFGEFPFIAGAIFTGFEGYALTDHEATELSKPLALVLAKYIPQGAEYTELSVLCATILAIAYKKQIDYRAWKKTEEPEQPAQ